MKRIFKITLEDPSLFIKNYSAVEKSYSACGTQPGWFFCYNITTYSDICDSLKKSKKNTCFFKSLDDFFVMSLGKIFSE